MNIGILLGSFDPIHVGHLYMAIASLNLNLVDKVLFVPSVQNPIKPKSLDFGQRCTMVQLALDDLNNCYLSTIDYKNTAPYFTSNTLMMLKDKYPQDDLYIIIGLDIYDQIEGWHRGKWILDNFKFIVVDRDGYTSTRKPDILHSLNVSSTKIRTLIKENKQIDPLVPELVKNYIKQNKLYE